MFQSDRDGGNLDIHVMFDDGTINNLTNHPATDYGAAWSPDGKKISFFSKRDGMDDLFVMNADGTNPVNLTKLPLNSHHTMTTAYVWY